MKSADTAQAALPGRLRSSLMTRLGLEGSHQHMRDLDTTCNLAFSAHLNVLPALKIQCIEARIPFL